MSQPRDQVGKSGLAEQVYDQLKQIAHGRMAGEQANHPLQTTGLVHEALLKLTQHGRISLDDRPEFFRAAAAAMRQILIDHARAAGRQKRGGDGQRVQIDPQDLEATQSIAPDRFLVIDEAITRLADQDAAAAELVRLRFYSGFTMEEAANAAGISLRTAERLWTYARAWLWRELSPDDA
jgi:RNA polymerase sigma factor (TIGR02999 family)